MTLIDRFEKSIHKQVRYLNKQDIRLLFQNKKIISEYFSEPDTAQELLNEILNRAEDPEVKPAIYNIKYTLIQLLTESKIVDIFDNYRSEKITREELLQSMKEMRDSDDGLVSISAIICTLIALADINLEEERESVLKGIEKLQNIYFLTGDAKESYTIKRNIVDLIYQTREWYFTRYQDDILKDNTTLKTMTEELNNFEDSFIEEIPNGGIPPESLGYIDITKLKGKELHDKSN